MTIRAFAPTHVVARADLRIALSSEESHYVLRARRTRVGEAVELFMAAGELWRGELVQAGEKTAVIQLSSRVDVPAPPLLRIELWFGVPDNDALSQVIAQTCELGISKLLLLQLKRSNRNICNKERMDQVARAAMRQCGNPSPPEIAGPLSLTAALEQPSAEMPSFFAWEARRGEQLGPLSFSEFSGCASGARVCIGPEGGFTDEEAALLQAAGFQPLSLGSYVLRAPTAVVASVARLMEAFAARDLAVLTSPPTTE